MHDHNINELNEKIKQLQLSIAKTREYIDNVEYDEVAILLSALTHSSLLSIDLMMSLKYMLITNKHKEDLDTYYFAMLACMHLHELIDSINNMSGAVLKKYNDIGNADYIKEIHNAKKAINKTVEPHRGKIAFIRNNLIAHKMDDPFELMNRLADMEVQLIFDLGLDVVQLTYNFSIGIISFIRNSKSFRK